MEYFSWNSVDYKSGTYLLGKSMEYFAHNPMESPLKISHVFPMEFREL